jgi:hypothetical protein
VGGLFGEWNKISDEDNASSGRYLPDFWPPQLAAFCFLRLHHHLKSAFWRGIAACPSFRLIEPFADRSALSHLGGGTHPALGLSFRPFVDRTWMAAPPQKRRLSPRRRYVLEVIARSPDGATWDLLVVVHGISCDTIAGLVRVGLATVRHEAVRADSKTTRFKRYRITNAGRLALEGWPAQLIHPAP